MTLRETPVGKAVRVVAVGGQRAFRRRLMELGLVPGTLVEVLRTAPLGDPIELHCRGCCLSIRKAEASCVSVEPHAA